jgi:hypothetical protein
VTGVVWQLANCETRVLACACTTVMSRLRETNACLLHYVPANLSTGVCVCTRWSRCLVPSLEASPAHTSVSLGWLPSALVRGKEGRQCNVNSSLPHQLMVDRPLHEWAARGSLRDMFHKVCLSLRQLRNEFVAVVLVTCFSLRHRKLIHCIIVLQPVSLAFFSCVLCCRSGALALQGIPMTP